MRIRSILMAITILAGAAAVVALAILTQPFVQPLASTAPAVDPNRLEHHVRRLSRDFYPRSHDQFKNLERSAAYIQSELEACGASVAVQEVKVEEAGYKNIVANFGPPAGALLVIGAHYDSHGDGNAGARFSRGYAPETHTPGADDNASGVAGLIELACLLGRTEQRRPIQLVAYTLEEPPHFRTEHMGSSWHARALKQAHREVELMLSLEMIGYFSTEPQSQRYPFPLMSALYSDRGDFVALVGRLESFGNIRKLKAAMAGATALPVLSINAPPILPGIDFSDHLNYWAEGMPAIMVTDTAFMRNPHYHMSGDTFEKLDYQRMAQVVQGVFAFTQLP